MNLKELKEGMIGLLYACGVIHHFQHAQKMGPNTCIATYKLVGPGRQQSPKSVLIKIVTKSTGKQYYFEEICF